MVPLFYGNPKTPLTPGYLPGYPQRIPPPGIRILYPVFRPDSPGYDGAASQTRTDPGRRVPLALDTVTLHSRYRSGASHPTSSV